MVERQIRQRGVTDTRVLSAMETIPRECFVPPDAHAQAYEDVPLAIGFNQTISQPYIVAYMTEVLDVRDSHRVLEIGTGSAYQAAVLGKTCARGLDRRDCSRVGCCGDRATPESWPDPTCTSGLGMATAGGRSRHHSTASW